MRKLDKIYETAVFKYWTINKAGLWSSLTVALAFCQEPLFQTVAWKKKHEHSIKILPSEAKIRVQRGRSSWNLWDRVLDRKALCRERIPEIHIGVSLILLLSISVYAQGKTPRGYGRSTGNLCRTTSKVYTWLWDSRDPAKEEGFHWTAGVLSKLEGLHLSSRAKIYSRAALTRFALTKFKSKPSKNWADPKFLKWS